MGLVNVTATTSEVTLFQYYPAIILSVAYPNFVPLGNDVCFVLMEAPILANWFLVFYIDVWDGEHTNFMVVFLRSSLMVLYQIIIIYLTIYVHFHPRLALLDIA